jgi:PAS domain S-box-containing protein
MDFSLTGESGTPAPDPSRPPGVVEQSAGWPPTPAPALLQAVLDHSSDIIHVLDAEGRILFISGAVERVLGYRPEEMIGKVGHEFVHPDDQPYAAMTFEQDIRGEGGTRRLELRLRHRDGSWRTFEVSGTVVPDALGAPTAVVSSHDISKRKRAEEALRGLIAAAPVPILALDREGLIRTWNPAAERVFGWRAEEVMGQPLPFVPEHLRIESEELQARVLAGESLAGANVVRQRRDGSLLEMRIFTAPIVDVAGRIEGLVAILEDTTDLNRLEKYRTQVLQFVSHDLRSPLSAIMVAAEFLSTTVREEDAGMVGGIIHAVQQMERLILEVADAGRLADSSLRLERSWVSTIGMVNDALTVLRPLARQKGIQLDFSAMDDVALFADRSRLLQVLSNLLSNALRFTPDGGRIAIRGEVHEVELVLHVADTGCGVAEEDLPYVFERYWQANPRAPGTSGLGLAIARGIVLAHGGRIWAENRAEGGCEFTFTVPLPPRAEGPSLIRREASPLR